MRAIALNNKLAESRELARHACRRRSCGALRPQNKAFKDLGVKQAPFVVLIGAQMPSVLAEIAFVTNRTDAALLKQPSLTGSTSRRRCATRSCRYQASLKKVTTVAATGSGR